MAPYCQHGEGLVGGGWGGGHTTYLLDHIQLSPGNPPSRLQGQIGAACGKNSCLFSETDKSIQIMQFNSQPESGWKNLFLATVTDPPTPPSNDIQAHGPSSVLSPTSTDWPSTAHLVPVCAVRALLPWRTGDNRVEVDLKIYRLVQGEVSVQSVFLFIWIWGQQIYKAAWASTPYPGVTGRHTGLIC